MLSFLTDPVSTTPEQPNGATESPENTTPVKRGGFGDFLSDAASAIGGAAKDVHSFTKDAGSELSDRAKDIGSASGDMLDYYFGFGSGAAQTSSDQTLPIVFLLQLAITNLLISRS